MWKRHVVYESRPCNVIVSLGGHLYRIPEVIPTTFPHKQWHKVVSHTTKFRFFTICSKGERKDTTTTTASAQTPSIQQKWVDRNTTKCKDFFCIHTSRVARLVKKVQPRQQQVRDSFQQTKQHDISNEASNSPRFKFNKRFPLSSINSTQWRSLLPKEGGLTQVDIGGHPPIPRARKTIFHLGSCSTVFRVPNFWGHLEALNYVFWGFGAQVIVRGIDLG
jgi:hypothetical protein